MSLLLKDYPLIAVRDCTGKTVQVPRQLQGVELYVAWADTRADRARIDGELRASVDRVAAQHRAEVWRAMRDGWSPGEYDRVLADAVPRYEAVIRQYTASLQRATERWAMDEARRQARSSDTESAPSSPIRTSAIVAQVDRQAGRLEARINSATDLSARAVAMQVQAKVAEQVKNGARQGSLTEALPASALAGILSVGQIVESEGRISAAASLVKSGTTAALGLRLAQVVRTSVNDRRRCSVCTKADGTTFDLPAQQAQFDAMPLPDPNCLGGTRFCRCGWLLRWVRET
jgi:hypothetical protein